MRKLAPKIKMLQEQYGDDKMKLNQETMALYRAEKVNPAGIVYRFGANAGVHCLVTCIAIFGRNAWRTVDWLD